MPLPVIPPHRLTSDQDLLRLYQRTERLWTEHLGEAEQLDVGVAVTNPQLPKVRDANRVLEAALPPGVSAEEAVDAVQAHYAERRTSCFAWQMRVGVDSQAVLESHLASLGYRRYAEDVMAYAGTPTTTRHETFLATLPGITVLPTRAAFGHARSLAAETDSPDAEPTLAEARMLHLDDPHCDSLLALQDGRAVGRISVFAVGDIGRIDQVYVARSARRRGLGRLLLNRAMEICARSLFRHVLLTVDPANGPAITLYQGAGFRKIGELVNWTRA